MKLYHNDEPRPDGGLEEMVGEEVKQREKGWKLNKTEFNIARHESISMCWCCVPFPAMSKTRWLFWRVGGGCCSTLRHLAHPRLFDWHMKIKTRRCFVVFDPRAVTMLVQPTDHCVCEKPLLFWQLCTVFQLGQVQLASSHFSESGSLFPNCSISSCQQLVVAERWPTVCLEVPAVNQSNTNAGQEKPNNEGKDRRKRMRTNNGISVNACLIKKLNFDSAANKKFGTA